MFLSREHELKLVPCGHDPDLALLSPLLFDLLGASLLGFGDPQLLSPPRAINDTPDPC
jgi:hypothetical protein